MRQFEHFPNLVAMFFARAAENGDKPFLWQQARRSVAGDQLGAGRAAGRSACRGAEGTRAEARRPRHAGQREPARMVHRRSRDHGGGLRHRADLHHQYRARSPAYPREFSGASAVIVSTAKLAQALMPAALRATIATISSASTIFASARRAAIEVHDWAELLDRRRPTPIAARPKPTRDSAATTLACIIYTSGTGGAPRGVMQHHGAILHNVEGCVERHRRGFRLGRRGVPVVPAAQPCL